MGDPKPGVRLPSEVIEAIQEGARASAPVIEVFAGILWGSLLSALIGFLFGLLVYQVRDPNWPFSRLLSKILGRFFQSAEAILPDEKPEFEIPVTARSPSIAPKAPSDLDQLEELFGRPVKVIEEDQVTLTEPPEGCAISNIPASIGFLTALLVLTLLKGIDLLARIFGFVQDFIAWCDSSPEVMAALENLRLLLTPSSSTGSDPSTWPLLRSLWENPGRTLAALLLAVVIGGLLDNRRRSITVYVLACMAAFILIKRGDMPVPYELGIPATLFALIGGYQIFHNGSRAISMSKGLFGYLFTSEWVSDVLFVGHTSFLAWQPFSAYTRQLGRELQRLAYWAYQYRHRPQVDPGQAIDHMRKAMTKLEQLGITTMSAPRASEAFLKLARALRSDGQFDEALQYCEAVLALDYMQEELIRSRAIQAHMEAGDIWQVWGQSEKAEYHYENALALARRYGSRKAFADAASRKAGWHLQQAERYRESGDEIDQENAVHLRFHHIEKAFGLYQQALDRLCSGFWKERGNFEEQSECFLNMGHAYLQSGQADHARERYKKSLYRFQNTLNREGKALALLGIGQTYWSEYQARSRVSDSQGKPFHRRFVTKITELLRLTSEPVPRESTKSVRHFKRAVRIVDRLHRPMLSLYVHEALALGYRASRNLGRARESAQRAIEILEQAQQGIFRESAGIGYTEPHSSLYEIVVADCIDKGDLRGAVEWMERARSRELVKRLRYEPSLQPIVNSVPDDLLREEAKLLRQAHYLTRELASGKVLNGPSVQSRILSFQEKLEEIWGRIVPYDPWYVARRRGQPLDWAGMTNLIREQSRCATVQYFVCSDELVALLLLPHESQPRLVLKGFPRSKLAVLRRKRSWSVLSKRTLSDLVRPLLPYLEGMELLYIVPHDLLHGIPLHAGRVDKSFLLEHVAVAYVPSLTVLSYLRPHGDFQTCLAVGYGVSEIDRQGFEEEAQDVAAHFHTTAILGQEATRKRFLRRIHGVDILHLACHGEFNESDPLNSTLLLNGGAVTPRHLMEERLEANLVVLTACEVGRSDTRGIDEELGFARALLYAGAPAVIAASEEIDHIASRLLTRNLYQNLIEHKMPLAFALRKAQLDLQADPQYKIEEYWAPFMLTGLA